MVSLNNHLLIAVIQLRRNSRWLWRTDHPTQHVFNCPVSLISPLRCVQVLSESLGLLTLEPVAAALRVQCRAKELVQGIAAVL